MDIINKEEKLEHLVPVFKELFSLNKEVSFTPYGTSMEPTIDSGKDEVTLVKPENIKKLDIVLYQRKSGQYVLHRIYKITKDSTYTMCGDGLVHLEKGIKPEQIIGLVISYTHLQKTIKRSEAAYYRIGQKRKLTRPIRHIIWKLKQIYGR
ncbi:MAG: S24/S26 family peptidase [Bacilli bacterium]|jgi:hypothetical protein